MHSQQNIKIMVDVEAHVCQLKEIVMCTGTH